MIESNTETKYQFCFYFNLFFTRIEHKTLRMHAFYDFISWSNIRKYFPFIANWWRSIGKKKEKKEKKRKGINWLRWLNMSNNACLKLSKLVTFIADILFTNYNLHLCIQGKSKRPKKKGSCMMNLFINGSSHLTCKSILRSS